jgi:glycosyltransferase involved in cell wall biosynthesis
MKLSILIPAYNEARTIAKVIEQVKKVDLGRIVKEIIVIDDGSTDGTADNVSAGTAEVLRLSKNQGKGSAIRAGFAKATGDIVLIQDADLEYSPEDIPTLIAPIIEGSADVVYGSRFVGDKPHRVLLFHHYMANRCITFFSDLCTNLNLTDVETGYKAFSRAAIDRILPRLVSYRFGIEIELTARVSKASLRVYEVGVSYHGRTYAEGKKIRWTDGLAALWHIIRFNLFS